MRGLSLWQPWATLMAQGLKKYETRAWYTAYRGMVAIHAAARPPDPWEWIGTPLDAVMRQHALMVQHLPRRVVVAVGELVGCHSTNTFEPPDWIERACGNYDANRFAWEFRDVIPIEPVPLRGRQGLFTLDDAERTAICLAMQQGIRGAVS